ncbi:hypothetical protein PGT21_033280 [Puccinia graminis f. sp. tritici]|uniref:Uncharacterized protein n=1 Tax=Puccinia graminis f. sp. tritici TaxID=56615 RepID=A0A5B0M814_PUCGR|nr:hypothetical protein PGT21_033280 [Puccinia graminis f. sp. tritici]KAA1086394.1 hypothetical protein PGTUg99_022151 [Puccinia graminis f. sp. tritici]
MNLNEFFLGDTDCRSLGVARTDDCGLLSMWADQKRLSASSLIFRPIPLQQSPDDEKDIIIMSHCQGYPIYISTVRNKYHRHSQPPPPSPTDLKKTRVDDEKAVYVDGVF